MNYLAHLFLSGEDEGIIVGNFLGDLMSKKDIIKLPDEIRDGVYIHRRIDAYTDDHPEVRKGVRRLHARHSKYAPVLTDIYYDYFLAKNWETYSEESIRDFSLRTYAVLQDNVSFMPSGVQKYMKNLVAANWLSNYSHLEGIAFTFGKLKNKVTRPELLDGVMDSLMEQEADFDREFNRFFPDLITYVNSEIDQL